MPHIAAHCTILSTSAAPAHSRARVSGCDDSSEEIFGGGHAGAGPETERASRRTRHRRRNALQGRQIETSRRFHPDEIDPNRCQALKSARVQCQKHAMRLRGVWEGFDALGTESPPWFRSVVGGKKGRPSKKKQGRCAEEMKGVTEARENSRAQAVAAAEPDAIAELDATQGDAKTSASPARPPARISCFDDSSEDLFDDGRASAPSCPRVLGFDDSSDDAFFGGRAGAGLGVPRQF